MGGLQDAHIRDKMRKGSLRWFGHVQHRESNVPIWKCSKLIGEGVKGKGET